MNILSLEQILYNLPAIIFAFTIHEYMHAYVSDRLGDPTPRSNGRLTLNPIVHIDWIGLLMVVLLGFGWAKPVQTNPRYYQNQTKGRVLVSLAGPLSNLAIAFVAFAFVYFSASFLNSHPMLSNYLYPFLWINIMLFAFNILPVPPLDGFTLLEVGVHPSKYKVLHSIRQYGFMVLILLSFVGVLGAYISLAYTLVIKLFSFIFSGVSLLIGLF